MVETVDMGEVIIKAAQLAHRAHSGQFRKFVAHVPYIVHPLRVAGKAMLIPEVPPYVVAAAWLHDVKEDCKPAFVAELLEFPLSVQSLVDELTNPSKDFPDLNRAKRKMIDRDHLKTVSSWAKVIKFLDRIDNIYDLHSGDKGFQDKYSAESILLIDALLTGEDNQLLNVLAQELRDAIASMQTAAMRKSLLKFGGVGRA